MNKYITTVATVNDLPKNLTANQIGDFYYITSGNILCFYNGGATDSDSIDNWTQVNAQTVDTDTKVKSFTIAETTADATGITFTYTLSQVDKAGNTVGTNISNTFKIEKADINALVDHPTIGLTTSLDTSNDDFSKAKINLTGDNVSSTDFVNIKGEGSISVDVDGKDIVISGRDQNTTYSLEVEQDAQDNVLYIRLDDSSGEMQGTAAIQADNKDILANFDNGNNVITF